jgi:rubrerythrin
LAGTKLESFADFLQCASSLEEKTYLLYRNLADEVKHPLVNALLLHIAYDSQKHSAILKGISQTIAKQTKPPKNCEKKIAGTLTTIENLLRDVVEEEKKSNGNVSSLIKRLTTLESTLGEEYYVLVQFKTLQYMTKEIRKIYNVDTGDLKDILETIIEDEETHGELLSRIEKMLVKKESEMEEKRPTVKYASPDSWIQHIPAGIT